LTDYIETQADKADQQQDQQQDKPVASGAEAKKFGRMGGG